MRISVSGTKGFPRSGARDAVRATLPGLDTCLMCHQEPVTESPEEEKIRAFAAAGQAGQGDKNRAGKNEFACADHDFGPFGACCCGVSGLP